MVNDTLRAALGYMLPEGETAAAVVVTLQARVYKEMSACSRSFIVDWHGSHELKDGFGDLTVKVTRVGAWQEWTIGRQDGKHAWPIMHWEEIELGHD